MRACITCALPFLLAALGCGGSGTFENHRYADEEAQYRVGSLGAGWERLDVEEQNDLAWNHEALAAVIQVNASCSPGRDVPLRSLTGHLLIGFTERQIEREELIPLASREALQTHVIAKLDGVPRELLLTVLKKDGCVYDFALVAPPGGSFSRAQDSYRALLAGFETGRSP